MPVEVLESHCLENARKVVFFFSPSVLVFAGKCLDGKGKGGAREKANLDSLLADLWIHFEGVNSVVRGEEGKECRNNGVKESV